MQPPSAAPSGSPAAPKGAPSAGPSAAPTTRPFAAAPTHRPTAVPTHRPTAAAQPPSAAPSGSPSGVTRPPSAAPSDGPAAATAPVQAPSAAPSDGPSAATAPMQAPSAAPSDGPSAATAPMQPPSAAPSDGPSAAPSTAATQPPSAGPSLSPDRATRPPSAAPPRPSQPPSAAPSSHPSAGPTMVPSASAQPPTAAPSQRPSGRPSPAPSPPSRQPSTQRPSSAPASVAPSAGPASAATPPTLRPKAPAPPPTAAPSAAPSVRPIIANAGTIATLDSTASVATAVAAGPAAASAARLALVAAVDCVEWQDSLPAALHPTRLRVNGNVFSGAVVSNLGICLCTVAASALAVGLVRVFGPHHSRTRNLTSLDVQAALRVPAWPAFCFLVLYQGTAVSALRLVVFPDDYPSALLGVCGVAVCATAPMLLHLRLRKDVPLKALYRMDNERLSRAEEFFIGPGEWVSVSEQNHYVARYGKLLRTYRQSCLWQLLLEFASMFCLAVVNVPRTATYRDCMLVRLLSALVFVAQLLCEALNWPHVKARDNVCGFWVLGLQAAALLLTAVGFHMEDPDHWSFVVAGWMLVLAPVVLLGKVAADAASLLYVLKTGRRRRLQEREWELRLTLIPSSDCLSKTAVAAATPPSPLGLPRFTSVEVLRTFGASSSLSSSPASSPRARTALVGRGAHRRRHTAGFGQINPHRRRVRRVIKVSSHLHRTRKGMIV
eukprot:TRINITY_DN2429_c0_g1_i5.p1 TRINITY_DN2429_c0_g1~~TRINITY_DN2429_c0_g1_i5.p1  ORF type:complete len:720 (+),score=203.42 TRINITY_DN2429_c0_g1_i5:543-2702(+)